MVSGVAWWRSALWRHAPLVLLRYRSALVAVLVAGFLVALAASSGPFVTTGTASAALKNNLAGLSPLATGLVISGQIDSSGTGTLPQAERLRSAASGSLATRLGLMRPVMTVETAPLQALEGAGLTNLILMARDGALQHVKLLQRVAGPGVWISDVTARNLHLKPGGTLRLGFAELGGKSRSTALRVKGVYRALGSPAPGPYWANFVAEILPPGVDPPPPDRYVFMSRPQLFAAVSHLSSTRTFVNKGRTYHFQEGPQLKGLSELAVDPARLTLPDARGLAGRFAALSGTLTHSSIGRRIGCAPPRGSELPTANPKLLCTLTSSLSSAVLLADQDADEITPVISLLSGAGIAVALAVAAAAGVFLVRRRSGEAALLFSRGEHVGAFAARTGLELFLPTLVGAAAAFGSALLLTRTLAPTGSIDRNTIDAAGARGGIAALAGLLLAVGVASIAFTRLFDTGAAARHRLRWIPWEVPFLAVGGWLLDDVVTGGGLATTGAAQTPHLTLPVFAAPLVLVAGIAGLVTRAVRLGLHAVPARLDRLPVSMFLALRRLAAAQGALVALLVVSAVAFGAYFYAQSLSSSIGDSVTQKASIAYGGDVQGLLDAVGPTPKGFPYPMTELEYANGAASLGSPSGPDSDILAIDPASLGSVIRWYPNWGADPRGSLDRLRSAPDEPLAAIVAGTSPVKAVAIWIQGTRIPIRVIARVAAFPGMSGDAPLLVVDRASLVARTAHSGLIDPLGVPRTYVWARGPTRPVVAALESNPLHAYFVTPASSFTADPEVVLAKRTFRYMRLIAGAAGLLVIVGLLLYLQARQRSQAVSSALAGRMGLRPRTELLSLWLELTAIGGLAGLVGGVVALASAEPIVPHIDPLPGSPPAPALAVPTASLLISAVAVLVGALVAASLTRVVARRTNMSEALRVV